MFRPLSVLCLAIVSTLLLTGCAANLFPGGPSVAGGLITNVTSPSQYLTVATDKDAQNLKTGKSSSMALLGLFAGGDSGIDAAMKDGGITKVHHIDHKVNLILWGIWVQDTTIVHGE